MKVSLQMGPNELGVRSGADLDMNALPPDEAKKLRGLVDEAQIMASSRTNATLPGQRQVTIRIKAPDRQLEVSFPEGQAPPKMEPLLEYLNRYTKVIPD